MPSECLAWVEPYPTPQGGQGRVHCLCNFRSHLMTLRWCKSFAWFHETGATGLPGSRIGEPPMTAEQVDEIMRLVTEVPHEEVGS